MGPAPKPASQRRRRNQTPGARVLSAEIVVAPPALPETNKELHPLTLAFWRDIWSSPMAAEWDESDVHGLLLLAELVNEFWNCPPDKLMTKKELAAEIRLQRTAFGLSPIDRRRLAWEIERAEQAQDAGERRRAAKQAGRDDPRLKNPLQS